MGELQSREEASLCAKDSICILATLSFAFCTYFSVSDILGVVIVNTAFHCARTV